jgi:hypothetical protein
MDNANPTIINVSELPTRRGKAKAHVKADEDNIISLFEPIANPALQVYLDGEEPISDGESDLAEEPIDEQEIYGMSRLKRPILHSTVSDI